MKVKVELLMTTRMVEDYMWNNGQKCPPGVGPYGGSLIAWPEELRESPLLCGAVNLAPGDHLYYWRDTLMKVEKA